jgi:tetrahydrodipicolinate N-succinyltransferase
MPRILLDATEIDVSEDVEEILNRIVNSRDGLRLGSGAIIAPAGWVNLTAMVTGETLYVQVARIGYVRGD